MTPDEYVCAIEAFSDADDPAGLLKFASTHLADVMPRLSLDQAIRVNSLGEWAAMVVSLREAFAETTVNTSTG